MIDWRHWHNEPYLVGGLVILGWRWAGGGAFWSQIDRATISLTVTT